MTTIKSQTETPYDDYESGIDAARDGFMAGFAAAQRDIADLREELKRRNEVESQAHALFTCPIGEQQFAHTPEQCNPLGFVVILRDALRRSLSGERLPNPFIISEMYAAMNDGPRSWAFNQSALLSRIEALEGALRQIIDYPIAHHMTDGGDIGHIAMGKIARAALEAKQ